jgi:uncharacterized tellurite resistance protein B-like protein
MLQRLKNLFAADAESAEAQHRRLQVAAAALLIELGKADYRNDARETEAIAAAIRNCYALDAATIDELLREAGNASAHSTSLYEFTSIINQRCSEQDKYDLVRELWRVAAADGNVDKYENHLIGKIADLLYLPRSLFIRAKLEVLGG